MFFLLYFFKNILEFYQLGFINVCKLHKSVGSYQILFGMVI